MILSRLLGTRRRLPLWRHLALLVLAVVTPLVVFAVLISGRLAQRERAALEERLLDEARAIAVALDREFQTSIAALQALAHSDALGRDDLRAFHGEFARTRDERGWHSGASLVGLDGTEVLNTARPVGSAGALNLGDRPYFKEALATGRPAVSNLIASRRSGIFGVVFAVPVVRRGAITGVLVAGIASDHLRVMLGSEGPADWIRAIVDRDGFIAARSRSPEEFVGRRATTDFLDAIQREEGGFYRAKTLDGNPVYGAFTRARLSGWAAAVAVPTEVFDAPLWRSVLLVAGIGLAFVGASVAGAFVLARRIAVPVRRATAAAQAVARGEATDVADSSILELAHLGDALRESAGLLGEREAARRLADAERAELIGRLEALVAQEQALRAEAQAANRSKDQFLAMLGHELRNPLVAITSAMGVLDRIGRQDDLAVRAREIVKRQAVHLRRLVDDLLDVARVMQHKIMLTRQPIDLGAAAVRCLGLLDGAGAFSRHRLESSVTSVWISGDDTRIEQIITNLVTNAIKYTPGGGRIAVRVSAEGDEAVLRVTDTGIGLGAELLPQVFDLFAQGERGLDRREGGLGIGLTLVRELTELHGGRAEARSEGPGCGSEFTVRFPRTRSEESVVATGSSVLVVPRRRVLVVEDSDDARDALRALLEIDGHEVSVAGTGEAALEAVGRATPDIALIDIGLPDFDGYELARRLRRLCRGGKTRLVAVTGYGQEEDRRRALAAGFDTHIVKPVDPERLARLLHQFTEVGEI